MAHPLTRVASHHLTPAHWPLGRNSRRQSQLANWEGTGKIFCVREQSEDFRGVRLLGFWALGRHAVPSICTRKTIGRMSGVKTSHSMGGARADRAPSAEHSRVATWQASSAPAPTSLYIYAASSPLAAGSSFSGSSQGNSSSSSSPADVPDCTAGLLPGPACAVSLQRPNGSPEAARGGRGQTARGTRRHRVLRTAQIEMEEKEAVGGAPAQAPGHGVGANSG
eukprot:scaffold2872_cov112-Isochrysis_galbana.AAC.13